MARKSREFLTPDLTPLIDVVFLLLIFFLVSSVFKKEEFALLLKLPVTEQGEGNTKKVEEITIELTADEVAFNGEKMDFPELTDKLKNFEKTVVVNIRADEEVRYKNLVNILDILQKQKKENISLITEKSSGK
ncbi:MAG: biopolymer transporter ExbD [Halobacteriovoraceae bacterium]|nr:biopolymer transporter ExbD [Halobacteriovoraceae bacterium]